MSNPTALPSTRREICYVTDLSGGGRAIKFKHSGGAYVYDLVLQSGEGAAAVGVDPSNDGVFVGDVGGGGYHIAAYDSSGVKFDDFGAGVVGSPPYGSYAAGQLAVNATTHKLYLTDPSGGKVWIFKRIAWVPPPTATTSSISPSSQVEATLKATVNPVVTAHRLPLRVHGCCRLRHEWLCQRNVARLHVDPERLCSGADLKVAARPQSRCDLRLPDRRRRLWRHGGRERPGLHDAASAGARRDYRGWQPKSRRRPPPLAARSTLTAARSPIATSSTRPAPSSKQAASPKPPRSTASPNPTAQPTSLFRPK